MHGLDLCGDMMKRMKRLKGSGGDPKAPRLSCLLRVVVLLFTNCFINERVFFCSPTHTYVKKKTSSTG